MIEEKILILEREDLIIGSEKKHIKDIKFYDFKNSIEKLNTSSVVLFIDEDGTTRILKNRWGDFDTKWCVQILKK